MSRQTYSYLFKAGLLSQIRVFLIILFTLSSSFLFPQDDNGYYEISITLDVKEVGVTEIEALIKGKEIYLAISPLFDFLRIKNSLSPSMDELSGFFIRPSDKYSINSNDNIIRYKRENYKVLPGDMIITGDNLYLKADYLYKVFGLQSDFNFRNLSVSITASHDLPVLKEMRQAQIRNNLNSIKGEKKADTLINHYSHLFKAGMADWSLISTQSPGEKPATRLNLRMGAMVAGGDLRANLYYNSQSTFSEKQQYYLWRYANNDNKILKQAEAGKISASPVSTIYNPIIGAKFTNAPTSYRRSFGSYRLSDKTEPGWIVELYVNNVLVDFRKADASGFFSFDVPLVYGNTLVRLKFYGPWGEEQTKEQNFNIPYNFLPPGTIEYTSAAGIVEDGKMSRFSQSSINYGLSGRVTVGAGLEYLSSLSSRPFMPFVNSSVRLTGNMLISVLYVHHVKSGGTLNWRLPSNARLDLSYNVYDPEQEAIIYNYLEERRATLSLPLSFGSFSPYTRIGFNQTVLPATQYTTAEWMVSSTFGRTSANITNYAIFSGTTKPYVYSNVSMSLRLPSSLVIMPSAQYAFTNGNLMTARLKAEKRLLDHAFLNLSVEKDFRNNNFMAEAGFRYNFNFAVSGVSARYSKTRPSFTQYASGSLVADRENNLFITSKRPSVGKGGIILRPFLDYNANGKRENGEPAAPGLNIRANGGHIHKSENDTIVSITGLQAYTKCFIELDQNSFYNIAWQLPYKTLNVRVDPDIMKSVDIPVELAGEASGYIRIKKDSLLNGLGRIKVHFFSDSNSKVKTVLSEEDGYYSFFGLAPGTYYAEPDSSQLNKLGFKSRPDSLCFTIRPLDEGDIVSGLDFILSATTQHPGNLPETDKLKPVISTDTTYIIVHELIREIHTIEKDSWAIQLGAFTKKEYADRMKERLHSLLKKNVEIVDEGNFYKIRILDLKDKSEVDNKLQVLNKYGFREFWLIKFKASQQQLIIKEVLDSMAIVNETIVGPDADGHNAGMSLQLGAFTKRSNALAFVDKLSATIEGTLLIIPENGYYKVRITNLTSDPDLERTISSLGLLGVNCFRVLHSDQNNIRQNGTDESKETRKDSLRIIHTDETINDDISSDSIADYKTNLPDYEPLSVSPDSNLKNNKAKIKILAGTYSKRTQAMKARRNIEKKLKLEVEIEEQWDYYRVIVKGFSSKEDTYRYYPVLAGLGYNVTLLDENP